MTTAPRHPATRPPATSPATKVLAVVAMLVVLLGGAYLILSQGPSGTVAGVDWVVIIVVGWFFLVSAVVARITNRMPDLKLPLRIAFLTVAVIGSGVYLWDTYLRPKSETMETIVQAPAAEQPDEEPAPAGTPEEDAPAEEPPAENQLLGTGGFEGVAGHSASGDASLIETPDGQVLTFDDFEVTQGPDLRVYLVRGDEVSGDNFIDVGDLKAEKGRFQYELDEPVDTSEYTHVFVWCRAFSTPFGRAPLAS